MSWLQNGAEFNEELIADNAGFVYLITNNKTGKKYIGKKLFKFIKSKSIKGKRKRTKVESDWKSYFGSNKALVADVEKLGVENFTREILHLCSTKGTCNYLELREQIDRRVLECDDYYNEYILVRINKAHIKLGTNK